MTTRLWTDAEVSSLEPVVRQAALARFLGVPRQTVSRWVAEGMPRRADGRLDRDVALPWVETYTLYQRRAIE